VQWPWRKRDLDSATVELRKAMTEAATLCLLDIRRKNPEIGDEARVKMATDIALRMTSGPIMEKFGLSKKEMAEVVKRAFA
jgi:hypothetical protein